MNRNSTGPLVLVLVTVIHSMVLQAYILYYYLHTVPIRIGDKLRQRSAIVVHFQRCTLIGCQAAVQPQGITNSQDVLVKGHFEIKRLNWTNWNKVMTINNN